MSVASGERLYVPQASCGHSNGSDAPSPTHVSVFALARLRDCRDEKRWYWFYLYLFYLWKYYCNVTKQCSGEHYCNTASHLQVWLSLWVLYLLCLCGFRPGKHWLPPTVQKHANESMVKLAEGARGNGKMKDWNENLSSYVALTCPSILPCCCLTAAEVGGCNNAHHPECRASGFRDGIDNITCQNVSESLGWNDFRCLLVSDRPFNISYIYFTPLWLPRQSKALFRMYLIKSQLR